MTVTSSSEVPPEVEEVARQIVDEGRGLLQWQWDERLSAALTTVETPDDDNVLGMVRRTLHHRWNYVDVEEAPESIRAVADAWGGLLPGQELFAHESDAGPVLFAAWWPWGNGTTFSLRVGCAQPGASEDPQAPQAVRRLFSV